MKHYDVTVRGRVQGVYFRANALNQAQKLGLRGFVRNEADGSVLLALEGPVEALDRMVAWCYEGPPQAHVFDVSVQSGPVSNYRTFEIRRT